MKTLTDCLKIHSKNIDADIIADIKARAKANKKAGHDAHTAEMSAVASVMDVLNDERTRIASHLPKVKEEPKKAPKPTNENTVVETKIDKKIKKLTAQIKEAEELKAQPSVIAELKDLRSDLVTEKLQDILNQKQETKKPKTKTEAPKTEPKQTKEEKLAAVSSFFKDDPKPTKPKKPRKRTVVSAARRQQLEDDLREFGGDALVDAVEIVESQEDLPDEVKRAHGLEEYDELDFDDPYYSRDKARVSGVLYNNKIYLVQEHLELGRGLIPVLLHEGGHFLLRNDKKFQTTYKGILSQLNSRLKTDKNLREIYSWVKETYPNNPERWSEETVMHYLQDETNVNQKWYQEIVSKIKVWLNQRFNVGTLSGHEIGMIVASHLKRNLSSQTKSTETLASKVTRFPTPEASMIREYTVNYEDPYTDQKITKIRVRPNGPFMWTRTKTVGSTTPTKAGTRRDGVIKIIGPKTKLTNKQVKSMINVIEGWVPAENKWESLKHVDANEAKTLQELTSFLEGITAGPPLASRVKDQKIIDEAILGGDDGTLTDDQQAEQSLYDVTDQASGIKGIGKFAELFKGILHNYKNPVGPKKKEYEQTTNFFTRLFSSPEYYLRKDPTTATVLDHALAEDNLKYSIEHKLLNPWTALNVKLKKELPKAQFDKVYKAANSYLVKTDQTGEGYSVAPKKVVKETSDSEFTVITWVVKNRKNKVVFTTEKEQEAVDKALAYELGDLQRSGYNEHVISYVREARELTHRGFDMLVTELRRQMKTAKENGLAEPTASYTTEEGKKERLALSQLITRIGDLRGTYFPRERQSKDFMLYATHDNGSNIAEPFNMMNPENAKAPIWLNKARRIYNAASPIARRAKELEAKGYEVDIRQTATPSEVIFDAPGLVQSMDTLLKKAEDQSNNKERSEEETKALQKIHNQIAQSIADVYKIKGHLTSRKQRSKKLYTGYETDMDKALTSYAQRLSAGEARRTTTRNMILTFTGRDVSFKEWQKNNVNGTYQEYLTYVKKKAIDPTKQKDLYEATRTYISFVLKPDSKADRFVGYLKAAAVVKFLGFRPSSAAVNVTNMVLGVPATIAGYTQQSISKTFKELAISSTAYGRFQAARLVASGKLQKSSIAEGLSARDKEIFDYISAMGWDEANFNHDAARAIQDSGQRTFNWIMKKSMAMFGATEKANRAITIHTAVKAIEQSKNERYARILKTLKDSKDPKQKQEAFEQLMQKAKEISSQAHGTYGKAAKPWIVQKFRLLDLPYTFAKFQHNYVLNMVDLGVKKGEIKSAMYMLLAPAALAGAGASGASVVLTALAKSLGISDDPEEAFYRYMYESLGPNGEELARHGLVGLTTGINLKGSLQMNNPFPSTLAELTGAPGSVFLDVYDAVDYFMHAETEKGFEALMPKAFGNIIKGKRELYEGVSTGSYSPLFYGSQVVKSTPAEAWLRMFSFSPSRLSTIRDKQWSERQVRAEYTKDRSNLLRKFKHYYTIPQSLRDPVKLIELNNEVRAYNDAAYGARRELMIPKITNKWLTTNIKRAFKPSSYEKQRRTK